MAETPEERHARQEAEEAARWEKAEAYSREHPLTDEERAKLHRVLWGSAHDTNLGPRA